jgi:hypothetical protein
MFKKIKHKIYNMKYGIQVIAFFSSVLIGALVLGVGAEIRSRFHKDE